MSDDLISREYAIEKLRELFVPANYECVDFGRIGYNHAIADAEATIRFLPSAEPRWIPVSESVPKEEHGDYLVTATGEERGKKYKRVEIGQWLGDAFWIGWYEPEKKILAWMPIPEPWEGADDE